MDELTRVIAAALADDAAMTEAEWGSTQKAAERIIGALAPLIEARVREARAAALTDAADAWTQGAWASTPRRKDRVADRMAASQYAGDWLRERAKEVRRG